MTFFKYGEELKIFGRIFQINGCDIFTQKYYKDTYKIDFPLMSEMHKSKETQSIKTQKILKIFQILKIFIIIKFYYLDLVIPPYDGFGDEEDSLGYVYRLIPKQPKKDYFKWVDNQKNLRFKARLNTTKPEDVDR